jgi:hypothetical protein
VKERDPPSGEIEHVPALVPPGRYSVRFLHWSTHMMFGRQGKLAMHFAIMDQGEHFGVRLIRWYNCRVKGIVGRNGRFSVGWGSDLAREYGRLVGMASRADRIALTKYSPLLLVAEVETVETTRLQERLPVEMQYSVIRRLIAIEAGKAA